MRRMPAETRRALLDHPHLLVVDRPQLARFVGYCEGYADLERRVVGDLEFDLPVHHVQIRGGSTTQVREEARLLGDIARRLLDLEPPGLDLGHALEIHGARVFAMPLSRGVLGSFVYAGEIAPAFLVNSRLSPGAERYALAHLYCHYLVDNDPYRPEVCCWPDADDGEEVDDSELRADFFAEELLLPEAILAPFLKASATLETMVGYFELPESIVTERLVDLGLPAGPFDVADRWRGRGQVMFPERLVRLALEGIHTDRLDVDEFAQALHLAREDAIVLLRLSSAPDELEPGDTGA